MGLCSSLSGKVIFSNQAATDKFLSTISTLEPDIDLVDGVIEFGVNSGCNTDCAIMISTAEEIIKENSVAFDLRADSDNLDESVGELLGCEQAIFCYDNEIDSNIPEKDGDYYFVTTANVSECWAELKKIGILSTKDLVTRLGKGDGSSDYPDENYIYTYDDEVFDAYMTLLEIIERHGVNPEVTRVTIKNLSKL
jgi:hypothetical protein